MNNNKKKQVLSVIKHLLEKADRQGSLEIVNESCHYLYTKAALLQEKAEWDPDGIASWPELHSSDYWMILQNGAMVPVSAQDDMLYDYVSKRLLMEPAGNYGESNETSAGCTIC